MLKYPKKVVRIAEIMKKYGFRAYAVGGCVRDSIMGRDPSDWDMTTDASPEKMIEIFNSKYYREVLDTLNEEDKNYILKRNKAFESNEILEFIIKARKVKSFFKLNPPIIYYGYKEEYNK